MVTRILGDDDDFGKAWSILWLDDERLLVLDVISPRFFKIVGRASGRVTQTFGQRGGRPREFQDPTSAFLSETRSGAIEIYDFGNQRISLFSDGRNGDAPSYLTELPFRAETGFHEVAPYRDGYLGIGLFGEYTSLMVDSTGRTVERLTTDPPFDPSDSSVGAGVARLLNDRNFYVRGEKLAVTYRMTPLIDLINLEVRAYRRVTGPYPAPTQFEVRNGRLYMDPSGVGAYVDVVATDRLVFALFNGLTQAEIMEIMQGDSRGGLSRLIHVFDWEGRYLAEFEMQQGLGTIEISPDHRYLWTDYEDPIPRVAEWELPPLTDTLDRFERGESASDLQLCPSGRFGA